jgi:hypothetical protein
MALFWSLICHTSSTTNLNWQFLTVCVSNKLAWLLLNVLGGASRFKKSATLLWTLAIANLFKGLVALLHSLIESLLLEGDLTSFLKIFITDFFLSW